MSNLSARSEDYLKTIYKLQSEQKVVRVKDLALTLGVRSPTVVGVLTGLKESGLVEQEHYGYISLTPAGEELARSLVLNSHENKQPGDAEQGEQQACEPKACAFEPDRQKDQQRSIGREEHERLRQ